jgi:S1-C subfamily serine protease
MDTKDLALLKINKETMPIPISSLSFARLGQEVFTVGFPVVKVQGFSPKVSRGAISSLNGVNDDEMSYQIDVPIQPGNSGGPLINEKGQFIGVIVSKINEIYFLHEAGVLPQQINYAIKGSYVKELCSGIEDIKNAKREMNINSFEDAIQNITDSSVLIFIY